jgi:hypothetical protein
MGVCYVIANLDKWQYISPADFGGDFRRLAKPVADCCVR